MQQHPPAPLAHRIEDTIRITGASRTRIYAALRDGELEAVKIGRATCVLDESLRRWLAGLPRYAA
jgi:excisionase family DNA binding protein